MQNETEQMFAQIEIDFNYNTSRLANLIGYKKQLQTLNLTASTQFDMGRITRFLQAALLIFIASGPSKSYALFNTPSTHGGITAKFWNIYSYLRTQLGATAQEATFVAHGAVNQDWREGEKYHKFSVVDNGNNIVQVTPSVHAATAEERTLISDIQAAKMEHPVPVASHPSSTTLSNPIVTTTIPLEQQRKLDTIFAIPNNLNLHNQEDAALYGATIVNNLIRSLTSEKDIHYIPLAIERLSNMSLSIVLPALDQLYAKSNERYVVAILALAELIKKYPTLIMSMRNPSSFTHGLNDQPTKIESLLDRLPNSLQATMASSVGVAINELANKRRIDRSPRTSHLNNRLIMTLERLPKKLRFNVVQHITSKKLQRICFVNKQLIANDRGVDIKAIEEKDVINLNASRFGNLLRLFPQDSWGKDPLLSFINTGIQDIIMKAPQLLEHIITMLPMPEKIALIQYIGKEKLEDINRLVPEATSKFYTSLQTMGVTATCKPTHNNGFEGSKSTGEQTPQPSSTHKPAVSFIVKS